MNLFYNIMRTFSWLTKKLFQEERNNFTRLLMLVIKLNEETELLSVTIHSLCSFYVKTLFNCFSDLHNQIIDSLLVDWKLTVLTFSLHGSFF